MALLGDGCEVDLKKELVRVCAESLTSILLDPSVKVLGIDVSEFTTARFGNEEPARYYIVSLDTNDASMLRGAARSLKGSYKERLEGVLDAHAKRCAPSNTVYVEIRGPESNSVERIIPIPEILRSGKVSKTAPIVRTAERYGISYIQVRGRHLIAPSPAIAQFLERYAVERAAEMKTIIDLFAGTAVASKVVCRVGKPEKVVVVENDRVKLENSRMHLSDDRVEFVLGDAMSYTFPQKVDLVVADPYYEDVEKFLHLRLKNMVRHVANLVIVPGDVQDRVWNARMSDLIGGAGYSITEHSLYGQVILEAKRLR
jgi:hypothetical protein